MLKSSGSVTRQVWNTASDGEPAPQSQPSCNLELDLRTQTPELCHASRKFKPTDSLWMHTTFCFV